MKAWPWPRVLALLGKEGEKAMIDLILDCGIFVAVGSGLGTYYQLSGEFCFSPTRRPTLIECYRAASG